jgi:hypothetical protein
MRLRVIGNIEVNLAQKVAIERRMRFVFGRFAGRTNRVTLQLEESDEPLDPGMKHCRIVVCLARAGRITVEEADPILDVALNRAAERVGKSVRRELEKQREHALGH